jgi:DNA-binding NtrC family response regulator
MIAYVSSKTTVTAMKEGVYIYIFNPFKTEDIQQIVKNALEKRKLFAKKWFLKTALNDFFRF